MHSLANRLCAHGDLEGEVSALVEIMLEKNRSALRRRVVVNPPYRFGSVGADRIMGPIVCPPLSP
jgi:hypothetical protein